MIVRVSAGKEAGCYASDCAVAEAPLMLHITLLHVQERSMARSSGGYLSMISDINVGLSLDHDIIVKNRESTEVVQNAASES